MTFAKYAERVKKQKPSTQTGVYLPCVTVCGGGVVRNEVTE